MDTNVEEMTSHTHARDLGEDCSFRQAVSFSPLAADEASFALQAGQVLVRLAYIAALCACIPIN